MIPDLEKINAAGRHLLALINDILDLSKIEAGRRDLYLESLDLRQMLDEAVSTVAPLVAKNGNELVTDFGEDLGTVRLDLTKLRQALFNLLSNAAKFTGKGTITLSARRERGEGGDRIVLAVADTGIGIRRDKLETVFEEFAQADDSTTRDFGGTELGLAISRRFCRMMGGDITVASEPGKGSVFTIELPAGVDAMEAVRAAVEGGPAEAPPPDEVPVRSLPGRPILVVDDTEMNRDMLSRRLARKGYAVEVAEDGPRALQAIGNTDFDLVLLDIMMPGMDGYEVLRRIRSDRDPDELPVIMATARSESEDVVGALKMGANDYVTKPFDFPVVLARVATQVALKRSRDALVEAHHRMKQDLEAAARIQRTLLPEGSPRVEGVRFAWRYVPCDELAGDTLNVVPLGGETVGLFLLDVSGHGVPAALLSVTLSRLLSDASRESSVLWTGGTDGDGTRVATPEEVATELSRRFPRDEATGQYFTMVYGILESHSRRFIFTSAGHTPVIHLRRGGELELHGATGPPIALIPPELAPSLHEEEEVWLGPGDRLYLMSDGILEASSPDGEELGMGRVTDTLESALGASLEESLDLLLGRVGEWTDGRGSGDDVSVLALEIPG